MYLEDLVKGPKQLWNNHWMDAVCPGLFWQLLFSESRNCLFTGGTGLYNDVTWPPRSQHIKDHYVQITFEWRNPWVVGQKLLSTECPTSSLAVERRIYMGFGRYSLFIALFLCELDVYTSSSLVCNHRSNDILRLCFGVNTEPIDVFRGMKEGKRCVSIKKYNILFFQLQS